MGRATLAELADDAQLLADHLTKAIAAQDWEDAHRKSKELSRVAGQLLHRTTAMMDVFLEARAAAAVDRATKHT